MNVHRKPRLILFAISLSQKESIRLREKHVVMILMLLVVSWQAMLKIEQAVRAVGKPFIMLNQE